jgi:hypothetical protein
VSAASTALATASADAPFAPRSAATRRKTPIRSPYSSPSWGGAPLASESASAADFVQIGVLIVPGSTSETSIPNGRSSTRQVSASASSACFDAA